MYKHTMLMIAALLALVLVIPLTANAKSTPSSNPEMFSLASDHEGMMLLAQAEEANDEAILPVEEDDQEMGKGKGKNKGKGGKEGKASKRMNEEKMGIGEGDGQGLENRHQGDDTGKKVKEEKMKKMKKDKGGKGKKKK